MSYNYGSSQLMPKNYNNFKKKGKGRKLKAGAEIAAGIYGGIGGGLSLLGAILQRDAGASIVPAAILAGSLYGIHRGVKRLRGKGASDYKHHKALHPPQHTVHVKDLIKWIKKNKKDIPVHISDFKITVAQRNKVLSMIEKGAADLQGQGIGSVFSSGLGHLKSFIKGEKSIKPSQILSAMSSATGIAQVFLPELAPIGLSLKVATIGAQMAGSGLTTAGGGALFPAGSYPTRGNGIPKLHQKFIDRNPEVAKRVLKAQLSGGNYSGQGADLPNANKFRNYVKRCNPSKIKNLAAVVSGKRGKGQQQPMLHGQGNYNKKFGSRREVWHGSAQMTRGKLTKDKLTKNKYGRIVSIRKQAMGKALYQKHKAVLQQHQFKKK